MKKHILYIGLNDKEEKKQLFTTEKALSIVEGIFLDVIGGATISEARGIYTHENGQKVVENTLRVETFGADDDAIRFCVEYLKKALNQESIAVESVESNSVFM